MQHRRRANQKGNALVEFALVALVAIPLMLGTLFLGIAMGNNIQAIQISRDVAHMYAKGVDFSTAGNTSITGIPGADALLLRVANDPASSSYDSLQATGLYTIARTKDDLTDAFNKIASEIVRLAQ